MRWSWRDDAPKSVTAMTSRNQVVARAESLLGVRFRPQGRSRASGLDCIGLVAAALEISAVRRDYPLRGGSLAELERGLNAAGLKRTELPERGDILVLESGPAQLHLAVFSGTGIIHADAGLRRVVERPGPVQWPLRGIWRVSEDS